VKLVPKILPLGRLGSHWYESEYE